MLSYVANDSIKDLITNVCENQQITILNHEENIDFLNYIKTTKVNLNLIKYFIIDIESLKGTEEEKINSICYFKEIYPSIRIIIVARNYEEQSTLLTTLYKNKIYNIINSKENATIITELKKALSAEGIQQKDSKRFKKIEQEEKKKNNVFKEKMKNIKSNFINKISKNKGIQDVSGTHNSVYFFALFLEVFMKLLKLIFNILIFILTSLGLTILLNSELRELVFQILGLK